MDQVNVQFNEQVDKEIVNDTVNDTVNDIIDIFKLYPDIFPGGYFRFLKSKIHKKIEKNEIIFKDGVVLTWTKYKRKTKLTPSMSIIKGEIKINQLVNQNQGNGLAKKIFVDFIRDNPTTLYLDVKSDNERAIEFYKKNNFKPIGEKIFGKNIKGIVMKRQFN